MTDTSLADVFFAKALPDDLATLNNSDSAAILKRIVTVRAVRPAGEAVVVIESLDHNRGSGDFSRRMAIMLVNDDMPFIVDSITAALTARGIAIHVLLHPILAVTRSSTGALVSTLGLAGNHPPASGTLHESTLYLEVDRIGARERQALIGELEAVLKSVRLAVGDWQAMIARVRLALTDTTNAEAKAFLDWVASDNMTLLGYCHVTLATATRDTNLGLLRDPDFRLWERDAVQLPAKQSDSTITITKLATVSPVHRAVPLDYIVVSCVDAKGTVVAEHRIVGLFTSAAYATSPRHVPLLRAKVNAVIELCGYSSSSYAGKALAHVLETFPRDLLFQLNDEELHTSALGILSLIERPRPKIFIYHDPFDRFVEVLVFIPRDAYRADMRQRVANMLCQNFSGTLARFSVMLTDDGLARVHYTVAIVKPIVVDTKILQVSLDRLVRGWGDDLNEALHKRLTPARAARLSISHGQAFSAAYRDQFDAEAAAIDIEHLAGLADSHGRDVLFYKKPADLPHQLRLKIYRLGDIIALSDCVPILEHFGLRVIEEYPYDLAGGTLGWVHDFLLEDSAHALIDPTAALDLAALRPHLEPALIGLLTGAQEDDGFNALILRAGFTTERVTILRALFRYMRQTGLTFGLDTVKAALLGYPHIAAQLMELFEARFSPSLHNVDRAAALTAAIDEALAKVTALDDDRILRQYRAVILAVQRTNAFAPAGKSALAFKLLSAAVPGLPLPVPYVEVFIYSPRVEAIHLRGGKVARGGIRWSDRRDDFRTEILSLLKAQTVKNAVIVPVGAKGGFYPKQLPPATDRDAWLQEGTESYKIFIRTLLSITDNLVNDTIVPPDSVVRHDGDDPYLVVAADKGTAAFSDIANSIAHEAGFWLGDAFASGGSVGYDHKKMGITAKGAWISVERHFREINVSVGADAVRVVGVGDMSGDVFGNGMLLSKSLLIVAAFDHRHIFLDPHPDAAKSFTERERMFNLPRSSWDDYDKALISKGGGVFPRSAKIITLGREIKAALDITADQLTPAELIQAILKAPVDLLWLGGIGTYIKAANESHAEAGDKANDGTRVNADELRVKVIGEGANLGVTQRGRIAYAQHGGRLNTDFIDNSAGVDCSDNEVNIKILLASASAAGRLSATEREPLLSAMTDDVASIVLRDNYLQTQALSIAEADAAADLGAHVRLMATLEKIGGLNRSVEALPTSTELAERQRVGTGLTRPELAVLLAYAKMTLFSKLVHADVIDDALLVPDLMQAFPPELAGRFSDDMASHRLRRELIATKLANAIVNRGGLTLAFDLAEETGQSLDQVAAAFVVARELFALRPLWRLIDSYDYKMSAAVQTRCQREAALLLRTHMADILRYHRDGIKPSHITGMLQGPLATLHSHVFELLRPEPKQHVDRMAANLKNVGTPDDVAEQLVTLKALDGAIGIASLAAFTSTDPDSIAHAYTRLGEQLGLDWALGACSLVHPADAWERLLLAGTEHDCERLRLDVIGKLGTGDINAGLNAWLATNALKVERVSRLVTAIRASQPTTTAKLTHLTNQVRQILDL